MNDIKNFKEIWKKMMYIMSRNQKVLGIIVFVLSTIGAAAELLGVSILLPLMDAMLDPDKLNDYAAFTLIFRGLGVKEDHEKLLVTIVAIIFVYILKNIFLLFLTWFRFKYSMKVEREVSLAAIKSYMTQGYFFFRSHNTSIVLRGTTSAASGLQMVIDNFFRMLGDMLTAFSIYVFLIKTDLMLALSLIILALLSLMIVVYGLRKRVRKLARIAYDLTARVNQWLLQICYGIKEILVMNKKDFFVRSFEEDYVYMQKVGTKQNLIQLYPKYIIEILCVTGLMSIVLFRCIFYGDIISLIPVLGVFALATFRIMPLVTSISGEFNAIIAKLPSVDEIYDNLISSGNSQYVFDESYDAECKRVFETKISIEDVSYKYPDGENDVFAGISLEIYKGQSIALVGESGAGKSTLADILLGLYKPSTGRILMDGIDIYDHKTMWANNVGFVPQSVYLLDDTVRRNVAFGESDAEIDEQRVRESLNSAQLLNFIEELPDGLETRIGERGVRFSGGQAQRLAIARALYRDPQIMIFDEATSALDNDTERAVMEAIESFQGDKTLIIIAHRLTTVKNCDKIYEIKNGRAFERRFEELG